MAVGGFMITSLAVQNSWTQSKNYEKVIAFVTQMKEAAHEGEI